MYIYIDVLFIVNLYINWILLVSVSKLLHEKILAKRCVIAAIIGALSSFSVLLEPFGIFLSVVYKLFVAFVMCFVCFGGQNIIKHTALLFVLSIVYAGAALMFSITFPSNNTIVSNSSVYFDISFASLFVFTCISYLIICAICYFVDKASCKGGAFRVMVDTGKKIVNLNGIADSGNLLVDSITGKPIIVCSKSDFDFDMADLSDNENIHKLKGFRFVPFSTIEGDSVLPVFSPCSVKICECSKNNTKRVEALIGLGEHSGYAIFNPKLLL